MSDLNDPIEHLSNTLDRYFDGWPADRLNESIEHTKAIAQILLMRRELHVATRDNKLKELTAERMIEFQRQIIKLAPSLFNLMVSRETVTEADMRLIEAIAKAVTKVEMRALAAGLETKSAVLTRCFVDAWRAAHEKALGETPEDFDHGR